MFQWLSNMYVIECKQGWAHEYFLCYGWIFFNLPHPYIIYPWFTGMVLIRLLIGDWWLQCKLMTQVLIDNSSVDWRLKVWLMTQLSIVNSCVNWWLKCWLMTQIYGQKRPDLWPNRIVGMAMAIVAMLDFMPMLNGQHSGVAFATEKEFLSK